MLAHLDTSNTAIANRYDDIPYAAHPHRATHPGRLATAAMLAGHATLHPDRCRLLEVGCASGANLIAMAVSLPDAHFVGCDLSPLAIAEGRRTIEALGLANLTLVEGDLAALPAELGSFDFIVAHGVYSWVPPAVRDALFALANARLAADGLLYVSFNVLPGCRVRQAVWDTLHHHVDHIEDARERLTAARRIARMIGEGGTATLPADQAVRAEFRAIAERSDSELCHDDLAVPNEPVLFQSFVQQAARHGLRYLTDADGSANGIEGVSADARLSLAPLDPVAREQALDFLRLRRFRQSLLVREGPARREGIGADHWRELHVSADQGLIRAAAASEVHKWVRRLDPSSGGGGPLRKLLDELANRQPATVPFTALAERWGAGAWTQLPAILSEARLQGIVELHLQPLRVSVTTMAARPTVSPLARLQARSGDTVTSLLHVAVCIADANALRLMAQVDGTRDRAALAAAVRQLGLPIDAARVDGFVDYALQKFARLGLLMPDVEPAGHPA